jgi:hypothetical protein
MYLSLALSMMSGQLMMTFVSARLVDNIFGQKKQQMTELHAILAAKFLPIFVRRTGTEREREKERESHMPATN